jgi:hypothetical protein
MGTELEMRDRVRIRLIRGARGAMRPASVAGRLGAPVCRTVTAARVPRDDVRHALAHETFFTLQLTWAPGTGQLVYV